MAVKRGPNFAVVEDEALVKAWLHASTDEALGINRSGEHLYIETKKGFDALLKGNEKARERTWGSLQSRFQTISHDCAKYSGCLAQVEALNRSGNAVKDIVSAANELFVAQEGTAFKYPSCYTTLGKSPKWNAHIDLEKAEKQGAKSRKRKQSPKDETPKERAETVEADSDVDDDGQGRGHTTGLKLAKARDLQLKLYQRQVVAAEGIQKNGVHRAEMTKQAVQLEKEQLRMQQDRLALDLVTTPVPLEDGPGRQLLLLMQEAELKRYRSMGKATVAGSGDGRAHVADSLTDGAAAAAADDVRALPAAAQADHVRPGIPLLGDREETATGDIPTDSSHPPAATSLCHRPLLMHDVTAPTLVATPHAASPFTPIASAQVPAGEGVYPATGTGRPQRAAAAGAAAVVHAMMYQ
eukprot:GHVU01052670.1.p1 GENE.GHVU01052670.1~~GHVU01052670.1.p1  ORF type:complete len:411 (+),score=62.52 GHVU01052670.1:263-1495(+)